MLLQKVTFLKNIFWNKVPLVTTPTFATGLLKFMSKKNRELKIVRLTISAVRMCTLCRTTNSYSVQELY